MSRRALFILSLLIGGACLAAIMVPLLVASEGHAQEGRCESIAAIRAKIEPAIAGKGSIEILSGPDAARYLDVINAQPPETHLSGDGLLLVVIPETVVVLGLIHGDKACAVGKIAYSLHEKAMEAVREHGA